MLALILDMVSIIGWRQTEDGVKGVNPPKSTYAAICGKEQEEPQREFHTYTSGEDFEAARNEILRRGGFIE